MGTRFATSSPVALLANLVYSFEITLTPEIEGRVREIEGRVREIEGRAREIEGRAREIEGRGVSVVERMEWLCKWKLVLTSTRCHARVMVKRRCAGTQKSGLVLL
jgi:hypothetical protein